MEPIGQKGDRGEMGLKGAIGKKWEQRRWLSSGISLHFSQRNWKLKKERKGQLVIIVLIGKKGNKGNQGGKRDVGLMSMQGLLGWRGDIGLNHKKGERDPSGNEGIAGIRGRDGEPGNPSSFGMKGDNGKECKTGAGPPSPSGMTGQLERKVSQEY